MKFSGEAVLWDWVARLLPQPVLRKEALTISLGSAHPSAPCLSFSWPWEPQWLRCRASSDSLSKGLKFSSHHDSVAYVLGKQIPALRPGRVVYFFLHAVVQPMKLERLQDFSSEGIQPQLQTPALLPPLLSKPWSFLLTWLLLEPHSVHPNEKGRTALLAGDMEFRTQHFTRP